MKAHFINPYLAGKKKEYEHIVIDENGVIIDRRHAAFSHETTDAQMQAWSASVVASLEVEVEETVIDKPTL